MKSLFKIPLLIIQRFGQEIFINSDLEKKHNNILWTKYCLKHVLYHEVGHALDKLSFNETILKNKQYNTINSNNKDFLKISINNYKKFKLLKYKYKINKKFNNYFSYWILPEIKPYKNSLPLEIERFFLDNSTTPNNIKKSINSSSKIILNNKILNFSRPTEETWAESFCFVFDWIKNGFSGYDLYILKSYSLNLFTIRSISDSMLYILKNIDWTKLGIRKSIYIKRKNNIEKLILHIQNQPVLKKSKRRPIKKQKFTSYNNLISKI